MQNNEELSCIKVSSKGMQYLDMVEFVKEMYNQGYTADLIKDGWYRNGIGFTNEDKNIYVLCFFDSSSMTIYPSVPFVNKHKDDFDCYFDWFEEVRREVNNAHYNIEIETEKFVLKYKNVFERIEKVGNRGK